MDDLLYKIIGNAIGITDNFLYFPVPFKQKEFKNINFDKDDIYLKAVDNKLYFCIFETFEHNRDVDFEYNQDFIAINLANCVYKNNYYKTNFTPLSYSLFYNTKEQYLITPDTLVNIYSYKYVPKEYYVLKKNNIFNNLKIISHIMYKNEIDDYIRKYEFIDNKI